MQCMHPRIIRNPNFNKHDPDSIASFTVPCGRCVGCRIARTREWSIRLLHELDSWDDGVFLTLTYDDDHLPSDYSLHKEDLQKFFKRLRKQLSHPIKYFACGEYGDTTWRPHYHAIIFGLSPKDRDLFSREWTFGFNTVGSVTYDSCRYVAGYVQKKLYGKDASKYEGRTPPFMVNSNGIGERFIQENYQRLRTDKYVTISGVKLGLPKYYRSKLNIDTDEWYSVNSDYRDELFDKFVSKLERDQYPDVREWIDKSKMLDEESKYEFDVSLDAALDKYRTDCRIQYEKNMEARLNLKERKKC